MSLPAGQADEPELGRLPQAPKRTEENVKVWTLEKDGKSAEVTDTGWISGQHQAYLEELRIAFEQPLDETGGFPLPGMRGYHERRIEQLAEQGYRVLSTHEV